MDIAMAASRSLSSEISVAAGKPMLRGIHHLALVTDNMRMTLDFYVRVLGMPIVHGLRTPSRPLGASHTHGIGGILREHLVPVMLGPAPSPGAESPGERLTG